MSPLPVMPVSQLPAGALAALLQPFGVALRWLAPGESIEGSYWGESEAGLVGNALVLRPDTPVHSALHEACHFICADSGRRAALHTDAGGDDLEECAVCYLQVELGARLPGYSRDRMLADMDAWGYSFRLGSARDWFARDAEDARTWLVQRALLPATAAPSVSSS